MDSKLDALLKHAKLHKMTKEEYEAQRRSWVIGNMLLDNPKMTYEEALRIYNNVNS